MATIQKPDTYQQITDQIIEALERVSVEDYQAPFARLSSQKPPLNPTTGKYYNGINTLVLWVQQLDKAFSSNEWGTYKQWKDQGAQVKKGEKSSLVIFYKQVEKKDVEESEDNKFYNCLKSYCVFNADQVEGYEPTTGLEDGCFGTVERVERIEAFVQGTGAKILEDRPMACYAPSSDHIEMPSKSLFFDNGQSATENYYAVLLHELTHWSGGKARLHREQSSQQRTQDYAFEELIAELGSAFLCARFEINQKGRDDHAVYIKSWLKGLKNDKKFIFKAASQAQKAADYLNDLQGAA